MSDAFRYDIGSTSEIYNSIRLLFVSQMTWHSFDVQETEQYCPKFPKFNQNSTIFIQEMHLKMSAKYWPFCFLLQYDNHDNLLFYRWENNHNTSKFSKSINP